MKKLILLSLEGMNWELVNRWIDAGYLKNMKQLRDEGYLGEIECSRIPYESSGLVSACSGLSDSEHGLYSYWHVHNKDYIPKVHSSSDIKDYYFWNQEDFKDRRYGIVNIFGTHPVYKLNGYLISYAMERTLRFTYPPDYLKETASKGLVYVQDMGAFYKKQDKAAFLNEVIHVENMRNAICKELLEKDLDIYVLNYTCIDRVCHFYMNELQQPDLNFKDSVIFQMYSKCDDILGEILRYIEKKDGELILFSSVGFGMLKHFVEVNKYLAEKRLLSWSDGQRIPNWNKTIAFESVQGSHGININRQGFYKYGIIRDRDYDDTVREVISYLKDMQNPYEKDKPMFSNVVKGRDFYLNNPEAPDIVLEPFDWEYLPYGDTYWSDRVNRHCQTGWHRNKSVWGCLGSYILNKDRKDTIRLSDIYSLIQKLLK